MRLRKMKFQVKTPYKWQKKEPAAVDTSLKARNLLLLIIQTDWTLLCTLRCFGMMISPWILLNKQTYTVFKKQAAVFLPLRMKLKIVKMPNYEIFWAKETCYEQVAGVMPLKRYKKLRQFLHVSDNDMKDDPANKDNRLYNISSNRRSPAKLFEDSARGLPFHWWANHTC